ncbi:MAG: DUF1569 domain-containing protein [Leptospiraceae bacterium]|nr:DUF1569 domain-containing protein [Leptospiraceae bacterium]
MYRNLRFTTWDQVEEEIQKLEKAQNVTSVGVWSYSQILEHLTLPLENALIEKKPMPWIVRAIFGKMFLNRLKKDGYMKIGNMNPEAPKKREESDPAPYFIRFKKALNAYREHKGEYTFNSFMGQLSREENDMVNIYHIAHHLSFLNY